MTFQYRFWMHFGFLAPTAPLAVHNRTQNRNGAQNETIVREAAPYEASRRVRGPPRSLRRPAGAASAANREAAAERGVPSEKPGRSEFYTDPSHAN